VKSVVLPDQHRVDLQKIDKHNDDDSSANESDRSKSSEQDVETAARPNTAANRGRGVLHDDSVGSATPSATQESQQKHVNQVVLKCLLHEHKCV